MRLIQATEADSDRLKEFFAKMLLPGTIDFSIQRRGSFFDQYRLQSDDFETWMLEDMEGQLCGLASLVFQSGFINGEKQTWCHATDLRIAPTRQAVMQWAQLFLPVLERACMSRNCNQIFSVVEQSDSQAYNALIRPTNHARRRLPRYFLARAFHVVTLHGRVPLAPKPLPSIRLKHLEASDIEPLCAYLRDKAKARAIANVYEPNEFVSHLARWPGFTWEDFRVATDRQGNIIGCAGLWNGSKVQEFIPQTYKGFAHTLHQSLNLISWFGLARPTAQTERPMPMRFLTYLNCDNAEVFYRLADEAFSRLGPREFLAYGHFKGHWRTLPPRAFIGAAIRFGLYTILPPQAEPPGWLTPNPEGLPPEFEAAWI